MSGEVSVGRTSRGILQKAYWRLVYVFSRDPERVADYWRARGVAIGPRSFIGKNVRFGRGGADPVTIGSDCVLTGCRILGHDASLNRRLGMDRSPCMPVVIEDGCFIGIGAIVLMGTTVGRGSIVGAGAVVASDVPPGVVVAGNPARVLGTVDDLVSKRIEQAREHPEHFPSPPEPG